MKLEEEQAGGGDEEGRGVKRSLHRELVTTD